MEIRSIGNQFNNTKIALIVIILLSLTLRIVFVMTMDHEGFYFIDTKDYDNAAVDLVNNRTFGADYERPPVYPVFLAGVYLISYQNFLLVRLVQCGLGAIICILVFLIGKKSVESKKLLSVFLFLLCASLVVSTWVLRNYHVRGEISVIESNKKLEGHLRSLDNAQKEKSLSRG